jgi:hypothetical protein
LRLCSVGPSSIIQRIIPRNADTRLAACEGVRAFISTLIALRASTEWLLAILGRQRLDQPGTLEPRRVRKASKADAEIAPPMVAVLVAVQYQRKL